MSDRIWLYWEGPMPPLISLCCRTVSAHNEDVVLLDRAGFDKLFIHDRDIDIDALALNHKSDFIRAYLLKHYGGLYIDADCIVMRNLGELFEKAAQFGFVGYREPLGYMSCNFMAAAAGGVVISDHYRRLCETLRRGKPLAWLDLASVPMDHAIANHSGHSFVLQTESVMPVSWQDSDLFCLRRTDEDHAHHFNPASYCYMLSHNTIKSRLQTRILCYMPESALLNDRYFLSFLLRKSLVNGG
jgi:glycosyl transferase-like sugar-binding protein